MSEFDIGIPDGPQLPAGWTVVGDERVGLYKYKGALALGVGNNLGATTLYRRSDVNGHPFDVAEEIGKAQLALVGYLRAKAGGGYGKGAGPRRNSDMVKSAFDFKMQVETVLCLAAPGGRGTADCVRRCREAGFEVREVTT